MEHEPVRFALFPTSIGPCALAWTQRGVATIQLPDADEAATRARVTARFPGATEAAPSGAARRAVDAMRAHLEGRLSDLADVTLDTHGLPPFHVRVYDELRKVGPGATVGYGELARRVGSPGAARAVGQAVGKNPFPIVVPCQRVLAAGGRPGGFSAYGGVETKRKLLAIEGVELAAAKGTGAKGATGAAQLELGFDREQAEKHIAACDARLAQVIAKTGPMRLAPLRTQTTFHALARSIVYQQLSGKAAATIHERLLALFPGKRMTPEALLAARAEKLRSAGVSRGKAAALKDLAAKTLDGTVPSVTALRWLRDEEIIERLVKVRGIGRWTVEMLLIFRLGRPDVLPVADYGVRNGFRLAYGKRKLPTPKELEKFGEKWRPYRTAASWYLWRAVELAKREGEDEKGRG
jgi:O-6-methylguanine DNA methyltransferase